MIEAILHNIFWFILIISFIVFIHEFGHFYVAKKCGVKIEEFAIGFGKELFSFKDRSQVKWKFCLFPFGGYVKMFGDRNAASMPDNESAKEFTEEQKKYSFVYKKIYQKIAIVAAGPIANFILGIILFTILFRIGGYSPTHAIVGEAQENSPAIRAGIVKGDMIMAINDRKVNDFTDIQNIVAPSTSEELKFTICRYNNSFDVDKIKKSCREGLQNVEIFDANVQTNKIITKNAFSEDVNIRVVGIKSLASDPVRLNIFQSFIIANKETYRFSKLILVTVKDLILGKVDIKNLSGPVKIAKYSGKTVELGLLMTIWFMAIISINLGVINLLPIPVLDGGHLFYYLFEAIFGKPLPKKIQEIGFKLGFGVLVTLIIFTTLNDINQILK